jgi:hypothetical protein
MDTRSRSGKRLAVSLAAVLALAALAAAAPARADTYDPQRAGHPVRVLAYIVHPVGVMLDLLIFRPAHWIGSQPGLDKFFGHKRYDD